MYFNELSYLVEVGVDTLVEVGVDTLDDVDTDDDVETELDVDTLETKRNETKSYYYSTFHVLLFK